MRKCSFGLRIITQSTNSKVEYFAGSLRQFLCLFTFREFDEWTQIFDNLGIICESLINVHECDDDRNLFVDSSGYDSILTQTVGAINPKAFYGETMGFQFCPSMRPILKVIVASMASYYSFFFKDNSKPAKMFNLPNSFLKYLINPNKRAAKYLHATENSTTEFCQVKNRSFPLKHVFSCFITVVLEPDGEENSADDT